MSVTTYGAFCFNLYTMRNLFILAIVASALASCTTDANQRAISLDAPVNAMTYEPAVLESVVNECVITPAQLMAGTEQFTVYLLAADGVPYNTLAASSTLTIDISNDYAVSQLDGPNSNAINYNMEINDMNQIVFQMPFWVNNELTYSDAIFYTFAGSDFFFIVTTAADGVVYQFACAPIC